MRRLMHSARHGIANQEVVKQPHAEPGKYIADQNCFSATAAAW
jgi:hypothetical protein